MDEFNVKELGKWTSDLYFIFYFFTTWSKHIVDMVHPMGPIVLTIPNCFLAKIRWSIIKHLKSMKRTLPIYYYLVKKYETIYL